MSLVNVRKEITRDRERLRGRLGADPVSVGKEARRYREAMEQGEQAMAVIFRDALAEARDVFGLTKADLGREFGISDTRVGQLLR